MGDEVRVPSSTFSRRAFLATLPPLAVSCARSAPAPGPRRLELPLERFPDGTRVTVSVAGQPVEVLRTGPGVTARSLLCTHQGCEVAWSEAHGAYECPCHEGRFDAGGNPKEGPPRHPLATLPARVEGTLLVVGA